MRKRLFRVSYKITLMIFIMILLSSISIGLLIFREVRRSLHELKGVEAKTTAATMAIALDASRMQELIETGSDSAYYTYIERLTRTAARHTNFSIVYIVTRPESGSAFEILFMRRRNGEDLMTDPDYQPVGMLTDAAYRAYDTGMDTYSRPYNVPDRGNFITGYSPLTDDSGNVVALMCMSVTADDVFDHLEYMQRILVVTVIASAILFGALAVIYVGRIIAAPLAKLSRMSDGIASGGFDYDTEIKSNDEIGLLYSNFSEIRRTVVRLLDSLRVVSREQKNGDIDSRIHTEYFAGAYRDVAEGINDYFADIRVDVLDILNTFIAVSGGDFSAELAPRPGKKILANQAFDSVKKSLTSVYDGLDMLVKNIGEGEFSDGGELSHYTGDWGPLMRKIAKFHLDSEERHEILMEGLSYASHIQKSLLPEPAAFEAAFKDYSVFWDQRDVVGGDIYWLKNFEGGTLLCVCDCTGHGMPGALLTTLVVSAIETVVSDNTYTDTAGVIWGVERRLVSIFNVSAYGAERGRTATVQNGCDLAVLFVSKDGEVKISAGHISVFVCNGDEVRRIKGQNIFVGEGKLKSKDEIETLSLSAVAGDKFYVASDGLFDQIGGENARPFGYRRFQNIILKHHSSNQSDISAKVIEEFESYRGSQPRRDDLELISFTIDPQGAPSRGVQ